MADSYAITGRWDSTQVKHWLAALQPRQFQFAQVLALTRLGQRVKANEYDVMKKRFDRPTPFTLNSLRLTPARRDRPEARVWFRDYAPKGTPATKYLVPGVFGGERKYKRFERRLQHAGYLTRTQALVPASGAPLDAYGNPQRGLYARILSQLKAQFDPTQNETARSRRRRKPRPMRFFFATINGQTAIWRRETLTIGGGIRPVFLVVRSAPRYRRRFPFFHIAENTVKAHYEKTLHAAFDEVLKTAR